jgi:hypothetical protein
LSTLGFTLKLQLRLFNGSRKKTIMAKGKKVRNVKLSARSMTCCWGEKIEQKEESTAVSANEHDNLSFITTLIATH